MNEETAKKIVELLKDCPPFQVMPPSASLDPRTIAVSVLRVQDFDKLGMLIVTLAAVGKLLDAESSSAKQ